MSAVNLLYGFKTSIAQSNGMRVLTIDAVISETHSYKNVPTKFPVEVGLDITDHIRQEPEQLKLEGTISAAPLDDEPGTQRWLDAYDLLLSLMGRKRLTLQTQKTSAAPSRLINIVSGIRVWTNMAVESLEVPRDPKTGDAINFTMDLVNIRKASTQMVNVVSAGGGAAGAVGVADQTPTAEKGKQQATIPRTESLLKMRDDGSIDTRNFLKANLGQQFQDKAGNWYNN